MLLEDLFVIEKALLGNLTGDDKFAAIPVLSSEVNATADILLSRGASISNAIPVTSPNRIINSTAFTNLWDLWSILNVLQAPLKSPDNITWARWDEGPDGRRAVFRYRTTETPSLDLIGCCYPDGGKNARIGISADINGELVIDPGTGAVLRIQTISDLPGSVPTKRSEMMVSYGPVEIAKQRKTEAFAPAFPVVVRQLLHRDRFRNGLAIFTCIGTTKVHTCTDIMHNGLTSPYVRREGAIDLELVSSLRQFTAYLRRDAIFDVQAHPAKLNFVNRAWSIAACTFMPWSTTFEMN